MFRSGGGLYEIGDGPAHLKELVLEGRELRSAVSALSKRLAVFLASKKLLEAEVKLNYLQDILGLD